MSDEADQTRRWLINASGAAILSSALPAAGPSAQAAPAPPAAPPPPRGGPPPPRGSWADPSRRPPPRGLWGEDARPRAARRCRRPREAARARYLRGNRVRLAPQGRRARHDCREGIEHVQL